MGGGPRDIRTADPVIPKTSLKYRQNFAGECAKWPTENNSRNSCTDRRCTPSHLFSVCVSEPDLYEKAKKGLAFCRRRSNGCLNSTLSITMPFRAMTDLMLCLARCRRHEREAA